MFEFGLEIIIGLEGWLDIVDRVGVTAKLTVTPTRILQIQPRFDSTDPKGFGRGTSIYMFLPPSGYHIWLWKDGKADPVNWTLIHQR
jgi:hypothetical protein